MKQRTTTGPPGSRSRLEYLTSPGFIFRDPEVYLIAKKVLQAVDLYLAEEVDYLDLNAVLRDCADDVIRQSKHETVEVR